MSTPAWARAALTHRVFTGLSRHHLADLIVDLAGPWTAAHQASLDHRRGHARRRAAGAGPHQRIWVEHAIAEHTQRRPLQRDLGRRTASAQTYLAIAGLGSDRAARR